jgi:hypothetical protein
MSVNTLRVSLSFFGQMRKNQFNVRKPKNVQHIVAMPGLSQEKRGHPKVSISVQSNPNTPVRAKFKPRAELISGYSKAPERTSLKSNGKVQKSSTWDTLEQEPSVIIHDMDFEPASGGRHTTKVWN